jgi:hypothetical protein
MIDSCATSGATTNATALPTSEVVVAAHGAEPMYDGLSTPTGDTNHVLCRGQDEPLSDFGRRVEERLRSLRRKSSIRRVRYLLGPHAPHDWLPCRQVLVTALGLLSSGAEFELVAAPTATVDVVQTLDELMPYAEVGVRVSIRREVAREDRDTDDGTRALDAVVPDSSSLPGLARAKRRAAGSQEAWSSRLPC